MFVNELGRFVATTRYESLPRDVVEAVKLRILDIIAAGLVGVQLGSHRSLMRVLGGAPEASVWGESSKLCMRDAVTVNAFLAHAAYLDDGSRYTGGHPSSAVIPAACAYAECAHANGRALIAAVAAGYEVFLRLGRAIYPSTVNRGFQSTAVLGAVSSAAACASVAELDAETTKNAIAIACSLGVGLKEALKSSASQPLQVGRSCEGGVLAVLYAREGARGADSIIEQGFLPAFSGNALAESIVAGLGERYGIGETYIKVHGGCRGNHAPVDVVLDQMEAHALAAESIAAIRLQVDSVTYAAEIHDPKDGNQAQFSVAFAVAVALLKGNASIFQYTDANVADSEVRALMGKIRVAANTELDRDYPDKRGAIAEIELVDGVRYQGRIANAKGEPECPLTPAEVERKFDDLAGEVVGRSHARRIRDAVLTSERLDDVAQLVALVRIPDRGV